MDEEKEINAVRIRELSTRCSVCGSEPGTPCVGKNGGERAKSHYEYLFTKGQRREKRRAIKNRKPAASLPNKLQTIVFSKSSLPGQYTAWKNSKGTFGAASPVRQIMKDGKLLEGARDEPSC